MDIEVSIEAHEQRIEIPERDISAVKEVQAKIRSIDKALVLLPTNFESKNYLFSRTFGCV